MNILDNHLKIGHRRLNDEVSRVYRAKDETLELIVSAKGEPNRLELSIWTDAGSFGQTWRSLPMRRSQHGEYSSGKITIRNNEVFDILLKASDGTHEVFQNQMACGIMMDRRIVVSPAQTKELVVYSVCPRTFSASYSDGRYNPGRFKDIEAELDRIHSLGANLVHLLPFQEISDHRDPKRPGNLGNLYCIKDHRRVNLEFGSVSDLKSLISIAHDKGMLVIGDMVCDYTGYDHPWIREHPEWYGRKNGSILVARDGERELEGCAQLDLSTMNDSLWGEIASITPFWIEEVGLDGVNLHACQKLPRNLLKLIKNQLNQSKQDAIVLGEAPCDRPTILTMPLDAAYTSIYRLHGAAKPARDYADYIAYLDSIVPEDIALISFTENHDVPGMFHDSIGQWGPRTMILKWEKEFLNGDFTLSKRKMAQFELINRTISSQRFNMIPLMYQGTEYGEPFRGHFLDSHLPDWTPNILHKNLIRDGWHEDLTEWFSSIAKLVKETPALNRGSLRFYRGGIFDTHVLAYEKAGLQDSALVICNLYPLTKSVTLDLPSGRRVRECFSFGGDSARWIPVASGVSVQLEPAESKVVLLDYNR